MSKVLCLFALVVSAILFLIFFLDIALGIPFKRISMVLDIAFIVCSAGIGAFSYLTFREQR